MCAHAEALGQALVAAAAILRGERGWHGDDSFASIHCFACEDGPKCCPARVRTRLAEMGVADHVGHPQIFEIEGIVGAEQIERRLVVEVLPLPPHLLMLALEQVHGLRAALTARLPTRHPALGLLQSPLRRTVVTRVLNYLAVRRDEEYLQAHIDAGLLTRLRQWLDGHLVAGEVDVPAVRLIGDSDGLGCAFDGTGPADGDAPNLGEDQIAILEPRPVAILFVGEGVVAVAALKPWEARLFAIREPAEERLIGRVQSG